MYYLEAVLYFRTEKRQEAFSMFDWDKKVRMKITIIAKVYMKVERMLNLSKIVLWQSSIKYCPSDTTDWFLIINTKKNEQQTAVLFQGCQIWDKSRPD